MSQLLCPSSNPRGDASNAPRIDAHCGGCIVKRQSPTAILLGCYFPKSMKLLWSPRTQQRVSQRLDGAITESANPSRITSLHVFANPHSESPQSAHIAAAHHEMNEHG
jgi:hypothetical protein